MASIYLKSVFFFYVGVGGIFHPSNPTKFLDVQGSRVKLSFSFPYLEFIGVIIHLPIQEYLTGI